MTKLTGQCAVHPVLEIRQFIRIVVEIAEKTGQVVSCLCADVIEVNAVTNDMHHRVEQCSHGNQLQTNKRET